MIYILGYADNAPIESDSLPKNIIFVQNPFSRDLMLSVIREVHCAV